MNLMDDTTLPYDSFLLVSFGGPEGLDDVMPFLENVLRGKNVPRERMMEVAEHYRRFGGISPINAQNRALLEAIQTDFDAAGIQLRIYWGNRNWHPLFAETLRQMRDDGCKRTLAFFTSMFSCYSGCRQYRENLAAARADVGDDAPIVDKLRMGFNHPGFIHAMRDNVKTAVNQLGAEAPPPTVLFTAHSIPMSMADHCDYVRQLNEACGLVADASGVQDWMLVYQSRSGPPQQPWLEPDVCDTIEKLHADGRAAAIVVAPIGFVSDHMEVLYDLDEEASQTCARLGLPMSRAATVGTNSQFVRMIRELVLERLGRTDERRSLGTLGPWHDVCPQDCCLYTPARPPARPVGNSG